MAGVNRLTTIKYELYDDTGSVGTFRSPDTREWIHNRFATGACLRNGRAVGFPMIRLSGVIGVRYRLLCLQPSVTVQA